MKIKNKLRHGDIERIAELSGYSRRHVSSVVNGLAVNDTILKVAGMILEERKRIVQSLKRKSCF